MNTLTQYQARKIITEKNKREQDYRDVWFEFNDFIKGKTCPLIINEQGKKELGYFKYYLKKFLKLRKELKK